MTPVLPGFNDEANLAAADLQVMSAQLRTAGVSGAPFFHVFQRRLTFLTTRDGFTAEWLPARRNVGADRA